MFGNFDMNMPLGEKLVFALEVSLFGILMVFALLIILAFCIKIVSAIVRFGENVSAKKSKKDGKADTAEAAAQSVPAPLPGTQSQGSLVLEGVDEPTAAVIMAIVSDESGIPLNRLLFKSIKVKD